MPNRHVSTLVNRGMPEPTNAVGAQSPPDAQPGSVDNQPKPRGVFGIATIVLKCSLGTTAFAAALMAVVALFCGVFGFISIVLSPLKNCWSAVWGAHNAIHEDHSQVLLGLIHVVEIFIAAPLPFLVVIALYHYVDAWGKKGGAEEWPEKRLHDTKLLVFSLLLSLLTVALVSELISKPDIEWTKMLNYLLCMTFIAVYLLFSNYGKTFRFPCKPTRRQRKWR